MILVDCNSALHIDETSIDILHRANLLDNDIDHVQQHHVHCTDLYIVLEEKRVRSFGRSFASLRRVFTDRAIRSGVRRLAQTNAPLTNSTIVTIIQTESFVFLIELFDMQTKVFFRCSIIDDRQIPETRGEQFVEQQGHLIIGGLSEIDLRASILH